MKSPSPFFENVSFAELTLRVRDLALIAAFYRDTLGFRVIAESAKKVALSSNGTAPSLVVLEHAPDAAPRRAGTAGLFHVAFLFPDRASLGRMTRQLLAGGVRLGAADHGVSEALYLNDPEGNGIELYADRPVEKWPAAGANGSVTMFTDPLDFESLIAEGERSQGDLLPAATRIGHVHLSVSDLGRAERFYSGVLGFDMRQRDYPGALFLGRDGYHHHIATNVWQSRASAATGAAGLAHFTIAFESLDEFAHVRDRARGEGRITREDGAASAVLHDFDGIEIVLRADARVRLQSDR